MHKKTAVLMAGALALTCTGTILAGFRAFDVVPVTANPPVGHDQEFKVTYSSTSGPQYNATSFHWWKVTEPGGVESLFDIGNLSDNIIATWAYPGWKRLRVKVTYNAPPPPTTPAPPDTYTTAYVEAYPPNTEVLRPGSGIGSPRPYGTPYQIVTEWSYNGTPVIMDASTVCEEKLLYITYPGGATTFLDYGQAATTNTSTWQFLIYTLNDTKYISMAMSKWVTYPMNVPVIDV